MEYVPPEKMTLEQLKEGLDASFHQWTTIKEHGCSDPSWPDGVNMNLVRNHILYWKALIRDRLSESDAQLSMFDDETTLDDERPVPPKVPDSYIAPDGLFSHRFDNSPFWPNIVHEI